MRLVWILTVLVSVAAPPLAAVPRHFGEERWRDEVIRQGVDPEQAVYPFAITEEMRQWADENVGGHAAQGSVSQLNALQLALFRDDQFSFSYDENLTLTADQAFALRRGNCMSFTAMFVALSRSLGIPASLVSVRRSPEIEKTDGLVVVNRHVVAGHRAADGLHLYDFYVTSSAPYIHQRIIDDVLATAMYHTNLGGEAIRKGDLAEARRHLEIATALAPEWAPAWVNLGVATARTGDFDGALEAYRKALEVEPESSSALTNMSYLYRNLGLHEEAERALAAAARNTSNPFTLIAMADVELVRGNLDEARRYLRKARWWYRDEPEVYEALARLAEHEGDPDKALQYAERAERLRLEAAEED